jgi:hypothetical protein
MAKKAAAKKTGTGKKPGRPKGSGKKTAKADTPAKARKERMAANQINKEDQKLFLSHLELVAVARGKISKATNDIRRLYKTAKSDGFVKDDFDTAFSMQGEGGEKLQRNKIARKVTIARYLGLGLGETLDLFMDQGVEEQAPEQRAFDAGKQDALENKKADAEGFDEQKYLEGYHSVSAGRVQSGIKKTEPPKPASPAVKAAADRAAEAAERKAEQKREKSLEQERAAQQPTSGVPISRSDFKRMNQDMQNAPAPVAEEEDERNYDEGSMFSRRGPSIAH